MNTFIQKYQPKIKGTLSGWDRIMFRGCLRALSYVEGMGTYLKRVGCLLKDFGEHVETLTYLSLRTGIRNAEKMNRPRDRTSLKSFASKTAMELCFAAYALNWWNVFTTHRFIRGQLRSDPLALLSSMRCRALANALSAASIPQAM